MSYYYTYYIGIIDEDTGLVSLLGPYDNQGNIKPVLEKSRSFASDLHEEFAILDEKLAADDVKKRFSYENWNGENVFQVKVLNYDKLPSGGFVKSGYFLIDDVEKYIRTGDSYDIFYDRLDPIVYAAKFKDEALLPHYEPKVDEYGEEIRGYKCSDYMWFAYPDYNSKEYEVHVIKQMVEILDERFNDEHNNIVILMEEG